MILLSLTIFLSAFLLFLVQPIIAKLILPWFGGTAAVWSTCLVFFQLALLAGYFYADWTTRKLSVRRQAVLHVGLIAVALLLLPIVPDVSWQPNWAGNNQPPSLRILLLLTATIGLPYFLLSTTSPLLQTWFARAHPGASPYRLFALSNLASMLALLSYPFLLEPRIATHQQAIYWSTGFGVFAVLIAIALWRSLRLASSKQTISPTTIVQPTSQTAPTLAIKLTWVALSALGSMMLLGVSNHLTQNIASIPLLWVVPLALYLMTFIFCFNSADGAPSWYPRNISVPQAALAVIAMAWLLAERRLDFMLFLHIIVFSGGLFMTCMYCHGELAARKPTPDHLTNFYLMISVGGALGAFFIGILAPLILPAYYEFGIALFALALLATQLSWQQAHWARKMSCIAVCMSTLLASLYSVNESRREVIAMSRNFYGTLRVTESRARNVVDSKRSLVHGGILHGDQFLTAPRNHFATTYYKVTSGIGIALLQKEKDLARPRRVGIIGLGTGTLAVYGNKGDVFRFYDINPAVVDIARHDFTYLADSAATIEIELGDARLSLEHEVAQQFDVLAIDAFSSDSIPMHLITLEALAVYEHHVQPDGIIAFHVSNRFLDLVPEVAQLAAARGLDFAWIKETRDDRSTVSDWVLLSRDRHVLHEATIASATEVIKPKPGLKAWTDDFNNLVQVIK
jgi:MFS family permease